MSKPDAEALRVRVPPGLEPVAAAELRARGLEVREEPGGVTMPLSALHEALLWSRVGSAITRRMGTVRAERLPDGLSSLPWKHVLRRGQRIEVRVVGRAPRGLAKKCEAVIAKRADPRQLRGGRIPPAKVLLVDRAGRMEVALVAAADLWKRGWRRAGGAAPIRENLASGLLTLSGWTPDDWLVDPMCGSGTFAIEAAHRALGRAPGAYGSFAAEFWPSFDSRTFDRMRKAARQTRGSVKVLAADRSPRQIEAARQNAGVAGVDRQIRLQHTPFEELEPPGPPGVVVMNPPYGRRLDATEKTYRFIGGQLASTWEGWRYGVILPDPSLVKCLPGRCEVSVMLRNGGQKVWFAVGIV